MIRRDRHVLLALLGMLLLNVLTAVSSVVCVGVYRRRFRVLSETVQASVRASEKASVEAAATALAIAEQSSAAPYTDPDVAPPVQTRIVGYGQSKSRGARYIYCDVEIDGVVHREYIQRIPFSQN